MPELWLAFAAGMVSSLHCIGMCGPVVMGCIAPKPVQISLNGIAAMSTKSSTITPHLLYNSGRVISYSLIGIAAGLIGSAAILSPRLQSGFGIVLGSLMIFMAFLQMKPKQATKNDGLAKRLLTSVTNSHSPDAKFLIGFLTPLLPCGLLYGMAAQAAATSSPLSGAAIMGAFAFGSAPALLLAGVLSGMLSIKIRKMGTTFAAILLIVMGTLTIARGIGFYKGPQLFHSEKESCCGSSSQISNH